MVQTLEAIRGGGGSIRVGTVGTIGSLITRELESSSLASCASSSSLHAAGFVSRSHAPLKQQKSMDDANGIGKNIVIKHGSPEAVRRTSGQYQYQISVTSATTPKRQSQKTPLKDVGNSTVSRGTNIGKSSETPSKTRTRRSSHVPMLHSENISLENTPVRDKDKSLRKGITIVDIVDVNCGNPGGSLSNRLKKLEAVSEFHVVELFYLHQSSDVYTYFPQSRLTFCLLKLRPSNTCLIRTCCCCFFSSFVEK